MYPNLMKKKVRKNQFAVTETDSAVCAEITPPGF